MPIKTNAMMDAITSLVDEPVAVITVDGVVVHASKSFRHLLEQMPLERLGDCLAKLGTHELPVRGGTIRCHVIRVENEPSHRAIRLDFGARDAHQQLTDMREETRVERRRAASSLHQSEERFHQLVDAVTDYAIFMLDADGRVATWNAGAAKAKRYTADEIIGKSFEVFYTPQDRAMGRPQKVLDIVRREGRFEEEGWRVRKDQSRFWASVVMTALRDSDDNVIGFAKVTRDLTEKREIDMQLHASEERFHHLVDAVTDYAIFLLDLHGNVSTWNAGAQRTKGYTANEIVGQHFSVFYTPEDRAAGRPQKILETVKREGRFEEEGWRVRKDGSRFWADVVITALRDASREITGFAKVTRDLTQRREAEQNAHALEKEQATLQVAEKERRRLLTLLERGPAVVNFLRGRDLVFEFAHPHTIASRGGRELLGKPLLEALPEVRQTQYHADLEHVFVNGDPRTRTALSKVVEMDGRQIETFWDAVYLPVRDAEGNVEGVMTFEIDVTESVRARLELEQANRAKDEFVATMSHELRTPLNAITGWASLLLKAPRDAHLEHGLEVIERNAKAQARLVSDLLDVSRVISGKLRLVLRITEIASVLHAAADVVRPAAESKGVRLVVDVDPAIGSTMADPDRLQQVVWNLLINAVRFTPRGGRIVLSADRIDSALVLTVADTGSGIESSHLVHIFERFRQVDSSTTRAHGGLGLGLAIVRHLVEGHGGTVSARSEGLGHGATFTVTLPIRAVASPTDDVPDGANAEHVASAKGGSLTTDLEGARILAVDDDRDSLELLRTVLEQAGAKVTAVTSATEALAFDTDVDVIVSDIGMPGVDGYSFIETVRRRPTQRDVPAIALTAYARTEDAERAKRAGFHEHLSKPVEQHRLIETIVACLRASTVKAPLRT